MKFNQFSCALAIFTCCLAVNAQTSVNGEIGSQSRTFSRPLLFDIGTPCSIANKAPVQYDTYTLEHPGGVLDVSVEQQSDLDPFLTLYSNSFNPLQPCLNAIAASDDSGPGNVNAELSETLPAGRYIAVVSPYAGNLEEESVGEYLFKSSAPLAKNVTAPQGVPAVGIPGLIFGALSIVGVAGYFSRQRKSI